MISNMTLIDFHTQIWPERVAGTLPAGVKRWGKFWASPLSRTLHEVQPWLRFLPSLGRAVVQEIGALAPISHLVLESSLSDLRDSVTQNQIDRCIVLSDPTKVENADLIRMGKEDARFIPAIRIPLNSDVKSVIEAAHAENARILQLHTASDGLDPDCDFYQAQIETATRLGWIIIVQTGAPRTHLAYRNPENASIDRFENWFKNWPKTAFVIARMNFDHPELAIDFAEKFSNLHLETSWQPTETIAEAVRRIGSDRIIFGSDWPIMGNNQKIGIHRIRDAMDSQMITRTDGEKILGKNAEALMARSFQS